MPKTLLVLGAGRYQIPAFLTAKAMGMRVVTIDPDPQAPGFRHADQCVVADLADVNCCLQVAKDAVIDGVMTLAADYPIALLAQICERLSLPGLTCATADFVTNKRKMRAALAAANIPNPVSICSRTFDEAVEAARQIGGAVIFKPTISGGGRGVTRVESQAGLDELGVAFEHAMSYTRGDGILIEQFVDGPEFSVESLTWDGRTQIVAITDKLTSGPPHYVEIGHSQPSRATREEQKLLSEFVKRAVTAVGIDWAASHTEIRLGPNGPRVMEIGGRLGGGYITSHLVPISTGVDMVKATMGLSLGIIPDLTRQPEAGAAVRFLTPAPGVVRSITGLETARQAYGAVFVDVFVKPGEAIKPLKDCNCRSGAVICGALDALAATQRAEDVLQLLTVVTA